MSTGPPSQLVLHSSQSCLHLFFSAAMSSLLSSISGSPPAKACFACCRSRTWPKRYHQHVSTYNTAIQKTLSMQPIILLLRILMSWPSSSEESESDEEEDWSGWPCTGITCRQVGIGFTLRFSMLEWCQFPPPIAGGNWFHLEMLEWCQFSPAPQWLVPPQEFGCQEVWTLLPTRPHQTCNPAIQVLY